MNKREYYLGLDIGTDSVGYAVTDEQYNLIKYKGEPAWGTHIFDAGTLNTDRRGFRTARRRLERRKQRVSLLQELFAEEIEKVDPNFYKRLQESYLYRNETDGEFILFDDSDFTDKDYYKKYPTIHHLICELMENKEQHDVRLVYLAISWLIAHRGHFLSNIDKNKLNDIKDFDIAYQKFINYFKNNGYELPWECKDIKELGNILKKKQGVTIKNKAINEMLFDGQKPPKEAREEFPFNTEAIVKLLAGSTVKVKDLFCNEEYEELGSISLGMDEEKMGEIMSDIGDDFELISIMREIYDWTLLVEALGENTTISSAKVQIYEEHKNDLKHLKYIVKKYIPEEYNNIFRKIDANNYVAYAYHTNDGDTSKIKKTGKEDFSKFILGKIKDISPNEEDIELWTDIKQKLELRIFLPKQKDTDNRVIPHQLYWYELVEILKNVEVYLPFLCKTDEDGISVSKKIESIFLFKIPYFVGPLNSKSNHAWLERKAGKIYPWNFEKMVDLDASEQNFIQRMTNTCTYLPGEPVLPKDSLYYRKFIVLNEINNLRINGERISVELKQKIYNELFLRYKKVTRKRIIDFLISNGEIGKNEADVISGIDVEIKSNLSSNIAFRQLFENGIISELDAEKIIERSAYAEDKGRLKKWLDKNYADINEDDRKYICALKFKDFGRLSKRFLIGLEGANRETGEAFTILGAMWNTQCNLQELLSDKYDFLEKLEEFSREYYSENKLTLDAKLDDMYVSNSVRRQIYRTIDIVKDVNKAFGAPKKIFIEMARGGKPEQKGKRTLSRKQQILDLYAKCKDEDVKLLRQQLEDMGEYCDNKLQGDKLFLYYMQLGKSMYSGKPIDLDKLGSKEYDIDHIYPQAVVKDDSIINNKVLVLSSENGEKKDIYPINNDIRNKMHGYWEHLKSIGLISEEKYKRLIRSTPFSNDEKWGFINRQLTETSQATKVVATLLKDRFPDCEIVYCKARLTTDFRQEFELVKSRIYNDLHHAVDAYLNIVTGNVYNMKFSKQWFKVDKNYSIKAKTLFTKPVVCGNTEVWAGESDLAKVKEIAKKNNAHFTKFSYFKKGGLFDQMPVPASEGLVPLKKGKDTSKYGGYNKAGAMFYIPVKYTAGKKSEIIVMSVELLVGNRFLSDKKFANKYSFIRLKHILGKDVDSIEFPLGMRPWKVNTVLSLDGFKVCIAGIASGGKCLIAQPIMQFSSGYFWQKYLKRTESFVEKCSSNPNYIYDETYDFISKRKNSELYDIYIEKIINSIYNKRVNAPVEIFINGKGTFEKLDIKDQAKALLNMHQVFGRVAGGCDLSLIGGSKNAGATISFSATISNWIKRYNDIRLIDCAPSGLWEKKSENLLELI